MAEKALSGIYRLSIGAWRYIGQAANLRKRRNKHLSELRRGCHKNERLQRAFDKHGEPALQFTALAMCDRDKQSLDECERAVLRHELESVGRERVLNVCLECVGSKLGVPMSDATKAKIGAANKGKVRSAAHREAVRASNATREVSRDTLAKRSASLMGNKNALGHVQSAEHKAKVAAYFVGRKKTPDEIIRRQATRLANAAAAGGGYHGFKHG